MIPHTDSSPDTNATDGAARGHATPATATPKPSASSRIKARGEIKRAAHAQAREALGAIARTTKDRLAHSDQANRVADLIHAMAPETSDYVISQRRWLHEHPELGYKEFDTTEHICAELDAMGIPYERPRETGVVATLRGTAPDAYKPDGTPRLRLMMRADIDALPVTEQTGEPFQSQNPGCMHACGHDCHGAMLLGAARMLSRMADELHGEIRLVFQPAEEGGNGSKSMIDCGVLEGVDSVWGQHIWSDVPAGKISCEAGPRMAATDWWRIDVTGRGAHGAMPNQGADAVLAGAAIVQSLQAIVARNMSPFEPAVVTVGQFHGGTARNVMAGSAWMEGTVRTFHEAAHKRIPQLMERMAQDTAAAYGCTATLSYEVAHSTVVNTPEASELCARAATEVLGADALVKYRGSMPGEDFSEYLKRRPGVFVFLGSGTADKNGKVWPQHSPKYDPDERVFIRGTMLAAQYAADYLAQ